MKHRPAGTAPPPGMRALPNHPQKHHQRHLARPHPHLQQIPTHRTPKPHQPRMDPRHHQPQRNPPHPHTQTTQKPHPLPPPPNHTHLGHQTPKLTQKRPPNRHTPMVDPHRNPRHRPLRRLRSSPIATPCPQSARHPGIPSRLHGLHLLLQDHPPLHRPLPRHHPQRPHPPTQRRKPPTQTGLPRIHEPPQHLPPTHPRHPRTTGHDLLHQRHH